jgi:hypothetical protein
MNEKTIKDILRIVGLPIGIVMVFALIAFCFYLYRNFLETKKINLEIVKLEQQNNGIAKCY